MKEGAQVTIYELGRAAIRVLEDRGLAEDARRVLLGPSAHRQFEHSVMICDVLASIELAALATPNLRFISLFEILAKAPETTRHAPMPLQLRIGTGKNQSVVPDAVFGLAYQAKERPSYRFFVLEADRGTMPVVRTDERQTSLVGKLKAYREVLTRQLHQNHLGIPNLLVLVVTTAASRRDAVLSRFGDIQGAPAFLLKVIEPADLKHPLQALLLSPWERPGHPRLRIGGPA